MLALLIALAAVVFAVAFGPVTYRAIPVVPEYNRLVVFRLGRCIGQKGSGVVWLWPILDRAVAVDLRERVLEVPQQTTITKANAPLSIDFLVYSRIVNPVESVVHVADFARASQGLATTTLRAVIGDSELDAVLSRRDEINRLLQTKLDEVTARWGVKVTSVEIREIVPPRDVQEAMNRQLSAERTRRATVTEAEGKRQARITVAAGEKQAAILRAEGERQAAILRAEGFSLGLRTMAHVARDLDARTLQLQYLEMLKALGAGRATKIVVPLEFATLLAGIGGGPRLVAPAGREGPSPGAACGGSPSRGAPAPSPGDEPRRGMERRDWDVGKFARADAHEPGRRGPQARRPTPEEIRAGEQVLRSGAVAARTQALGTTNTPTAHAAVARVLAAKAQRKAGAAQERGGVMAGERAAGRCAFCRALRAHSRRRGDRALRDAAERLAWEHAVHDAEYEAFARSATRPAAAQQPRTSSMRIGLRGGDR